MAGLTTASLVSLDDPLDEPSVGLVRPWQRALGVSPQTRLLGCTALLSTAVLSISFLVFLNSAQPFVLDQLGVDKHERGHVTGQLILADELVALAGYLVWGYCADSILGVRKVASLGYAIVALALVLFVSVDSVFPGLLTIRILFASGASALVTTLSAALSLLTALPLDHERDSNDNNRDDVGTSAARPANSGRFSGLLGFATGCGALLGVFVFLPLPTKLADWFPLDSDKASVQRGLKWTFYLVAILALAEAIFIFVALRIDQPVVSDTDEHDKVTISVAVKDVGKGFSLVKTESRVTLAYVASFASRATSSIATGFIPLLVNHYFTTHDLCHSRMLELPAKEACRPAFIRSSILTGVLQLSSLLLAPFVGILASRLSEPVVLLSSSVIGATAFILFATMPHGDPRAATSWPSVIGMGMSQIGGIVTSLSLIASVRGRLVLQNAKEVGGRLSAAYSFCGGLGILVIGKIGGSLFDKWVGAPFVLVGASHVVVAVVALYVIIRPRIQSQGRIHLE
ncbi:hypothetical protein OIV83_005374 [Microbotryomycetes sp. JL201]|nr:hypothetical protein OIV83_005374 [Microbotryomycetes sp. JL201]